MDKGHHYVNIALFHAGKIICMVYLFHESMHVN